MRPSWSSSTPEPPRGAPEPARRPGPRPHSGRGPRRVRPRRRASTPAATPADRSRGMLRCVHSRVHTVTSHLQAGVWTDLPLGCGPAAGVGTCGERWCGWDGRVRRVRRVADRPGVSRSGHGCRAVVPVCPQRCAQLGTELHACSYRGAIRPESPACTGLRHPAAHRGDRLRPQRWTNLRETPPRPLWTEGCGVTVPRSSTGRPVDGAGTVTPVSVRRRPAGRAPAHHPVDDGPGAPGTHEAPVRVDGGLGRAEWDGTVSASAST